MASKPKKSATTKSDEDGVALAQVDLARFMSTRAEYRSFQMWLIGDSPLIVHAWSQKAKDDMLKKQIKALKGEGKQKRDPDAEFVASMYPMPEGGYGFPATAFKKCFLSVAHKDKGIPRDSVMRSLWIHAEWVNVETAHKEAFCNLPLIRIYGSEPVMREDMVRIGAGLRKTANLSYRAQFTNWAVKIRGKYNSGVINPDVIDFLAGELGLSTGIGDWRNEKSGVFGMFRRATPEEVGQWEAYAAGKGPLPKNEFFLEAAE